jgi:hypothetical protein
LFFCFSFVPEAWDAGVIPRITDTKTYEKGGGWGPDERYWVWSPHGWYISGATSFSKRSSPLN